VTALWWVGNIVLLVVVLPVVIYLLHNVLRSARSVTPSVRRIADVTARGSKDLDATGLLVTTDEQVKQTIAVAANYGGSLDVIVDDADEGAS
jgi:hypothetical protein